METRELNLEEKKAFIVFAIGTLVSRYELFICHCFNAFVGEQTEMNDFPGIDDADDYMHIIFPELYNELKTLAGDKSMERYNKNNTRSYGSFNESWKCCVWQTEEIEERIHFLNDLNEQL